MKRSRINVIAQVGLMITMASLVACGSLPYMWDKVIETVPPEDVRYFVQLVEDSRGSPVQLAESDVNKVLSYLHGPVRRDFESGFAAATWVERRDGRLSFIRFSPDLKRYSEVRFDGDGRFFMSGGGAIATLDKPLSAYGLP